MSARTRTNSVPPRCWARLSAITVRHRGAGLDSPTVHELVRRAVAGLRRKHGARPAALALRAYRDRALLLVGYAAALRRSERVALDVGDLIEDPAGLSVFIASSKTDQEGLGTFIGIVHCHPPTCCTATCPIRAWREWRDTLATTLGCSTDALPAASPAFRPITRHSRLGTPTDPDPHTRLTGQSVALLVKQAVALLDDPTRFPPGQYAGHSLRARHPGRSAGVPLDRIMRQTRHASIAVALRYIREADIWKDNASAVLGL